MRAPSSPSCWRASGGKITPRLGHVYVVADNCTDNTAQIAAACGAGVSSARISCRWARASRCGFCCKKIQEEYPQEHYDGYFVFDADNLLDPRYITEMNKVFSSGNRVVTSYRNTKNYGDNWITAGYGLWFLRESEYLNRPRITWAPAAPCPAPGSSLPTACWKSWADGTTSSSPRIWSSPPTWSAAGRKIAYCHDAVIYDEQPSSFAQSIRQRSRWQRGYLQVVAKHGGNMVKTMLCDGSFACFDMLMCTIPAVVLSVISLLLNGVMFVVGVTIARKQLDIFFASVIMSAVNSYLVMLLMGLLPLVTEWRRIRCSRGKKIGYLFTFPFFVFTFGIAMVLAVFGNIEWKPIKHSVALSIGDMGSVSPQELRKIRKGRKL